MTDYIQQICRLPITFKAGNKSPLTLVRESKFSKFYKGISPQNINEYLKENKRLMNSWQTWSEDKRTSCGYFLSLSKGNCYIASMDENGRITFKKAFNSDIDACSEYIIREVCSIAGIGYIF